MPLTSGHFKLPLILSTVNEKILSKDGTSTDNDCYYIFIHHLTFAGLLGRNSYKSALHRCCVRKVRSGWSISQALFSGQRNRDKTGLGDRDHTCAGQVTLPTLPVPSAHSWTFQRP